MAKARGVDFIDGVLGDGLPVRLLSGGKEYQKRSAALLTNFRRRPTVLNVVTKDLLCLPEHLKYVYFVASRIYWSLEFQFEARMRGRQEVFPGGQNLEMVSVRVLDRPLYY